MADQKKVGHSGLSEQDVQDLMTIRARLPKDDPRSEKINQLLTQSMNEANEPRHGEPTEKPDTNPASLLYKAATNPAGAGANPNSLVGGARQVGGRAMGAITAPLVHPVQTAEGIENTIRHPINTAGGRISEFKNEWQQSPALALENAAGDALGAVEGGRIGNAAAKTMSAPIANAMQSGGEGIINRTIGATKSDFARGANPGKGYFQARLGPSMSMSSIADKAKVAHDTAGANIGNAIDTATARGVTIPLNEGVKPIAGPINYAHGVLSGPGGGSTAGIEDLSETFRPSLMSATQKGSFTPREYFDIKHNVAKNTSWGNPTDVGIKSTRQAIAGGMSEPLVENVPELQTLNPEFQNTGKLLERSGYRSNTGISPLTQMGRRAAEGAIGAGLGYSTGHPLLMAAPLLLDSVPVRTGVASGLYYGGEALPSLLRPPLRLASPSAAVSGVEKEQP